MNFVADRSKEDGERPKEVHKIEMTKTGKKRLNGQKLEQQIAKIADRGLAGGRMQRGWRIEIANKETWKTPHHSMGNYVYTCKLQVVNESKRAKETTLRQDWDNIVKIISAAGHAPGWEILLLDGRVADAKDERIPKPVGYVPIDIPDNWREGLGHIYERDAQIDIIMSAIKAGIHSNFQDRFHCALIGDPACIAGDATVELCRYGNNFELPLAQFYRLFKSVPEGGKSTYIGIWDTEVPTYIRCRADDGGIRWGRVAAVHHTGTKPVLVVRTAAGRMVRGTDDHLFLTEGGWRPLGELGVGDAVAVSATADGTAFDPIIILESDGVSDVYDVSLVGEPHNFLAGGVVAHNCGKTETLRSIKNILGEEAVLEYDATATTQAGAIKDLNDRDELPRLLIVEEIEKTDENSLRWLLSVMDHRAEIRKTTYRENVQKETRLLTLATVNDYKLFQKIMFGALASRFVHHIHFPRPTRALLQKILEREVARVRGDKRWIRPTLDFAVSERIYDPRKVCAICLCGRDELLDKSYQMKLKATSASTYVKDHADEARARKEDESS